MKSKTDFKSTSGVWLVVAGAKARFKPDQAKESFAREYSHMSANPFCFVERSGLSQRPDFGTCIGKNTNHLRRKQTGGDSRIFAGVFVRRKLGSTNPATINNFGGYEFMLNPVDGRLNGGRRNDKFRIKIWDKLSGNVFCDNRIGSSDASDYWRRQHNYS